MNSEPLHYQARSFGLLWQSDIKIEHFADAFGSDSNADIIVSETNHLIERQPIHSINRGIIYADGFRFTWNDIATFDMFDGNRVEYCPGANWTGDLPWPFYSTVTALLLAWRGCIPFHGSAISVDGQSVLICGESGAGKSSLTAALISQGAQFISDDLSVVVPDKAQSCFNLVPGRPGIRLFPAVGQWFFSNDVHPLHDDPRDKVIAVPQSYIDGNAVPLRHVVFLSSSENALSEIDRFIRLRKQLFRPNWLDKLPGIAAIRVAVRDISVSAHVSIEPVIGETNQAGLRARAQAIIDRVQSVAV